MLLSQVLVVLAAVEVSQAALQAFTKGGVIQHGGPELLEREVQHVIKLSNHPTEDQFQVIVQEVCTIGVVDGILWQEAQKV